MTITAQQLRELAGKADALPFGDEWVGLKEGIQHLLWRNIEAIISALELQDLLEKPETVEEVALAWEPDKAWDAFTLWFFRECNAGTRRHLWSIFCLPIDEIRDEGTERIAWKYIRDQIIAMKGTAQ